MKKRIDYSDYKISRIKYSEESRLGIGYILQCDKGENFGIIYGYRNHRYSYYQEKTWLYFFNKPKSLFYEKFTEISYIKSSSGYNNPESFQVSDVFPLSNYKIIETDNELIRGVDKRRDDGLYYYDIQWDLMSNGMPFMDLDGCSIHVFYPIIDTKNNTIVFHDYSAYTRNKRANIVSCFIGMHDLFLYSTEPTFEYVSSKLETIKNYIEKFNLFADARKFVAGQSGYFQSRPGRDDHFNTTKYWRSSSNDSYTRSLVNLHEEHDYYVCCGKGIGDEDYDTIDSEETKKMRLELKQKYNKDAHYMFLLNEFFTGLKEQRKQYLLYSKDIRSFVEKGDEELFQHHYDENEFQQVIQQYNNKKK